MSGQRSITAAEAAKYAIDPRNDNGEPNSLHVMAFSYDSDCPNDEDHVGAVIANLKGWFDGDAFVDSEADAKLYESVEEARLVVDGLNAVPAYSGSFVMANPCRCYDGITSDDVDTWTENGEFDLDSFALWGPFILVWEGEHDPGPPRDFTVGEALDAIQSRLEAYENGIGNDGLTGRMDRAINVLHRLVKSIEDDTYDEWGEAGDCWERIVNDDSILAQFAEEHEGKMPDLDDDPTRDAVTEWAKAKGLGRHYGAHCIWCLQAP